MTLLLRSLNGFICSLALIAGCFCWSVATANAEEPQADATIPQRPAWKTSRVTGSPDPAPPYKTELVYPGLTFKEPVTLARLPETNRLLVMQLKQGLVSFEDTPDVKSFDMFFDYAKHIPKFWRAYGIAFSPNYKEDRTVYLCYVLTRGEPLGSRVSRFKVAADAEVPHLIPESEEILLAWPSGGHNGGSIKFGADGYLYISTGDGANPVPPDEFRTGQNLGDMRAKILRIDVSKTSTDKPYAIPDDNPFVDLPDALPEVYAYGMRNPWKIAFDPTGTQLWVGDVGWEMWEQIHLIRRGGNHGWSIMEASQPIHPESKRGPTALVPPVVALSRSEALSITGGVFYEGEKFKDLAGAYTYGDFITGTMWALKYADEKLQWQKVLAQTTHEIIDFGTDRDGELLILDYGGTLHKLVKNDVKDNSADFPRQLSNTGLFQDVASHQISPGVVPYNIQAKAFADHTTSELFLALPGVSQIKLDADRAKWEFPKDAVLAKTISLELKQGDPVSRQRLETQLMHFDGIRWNGYTYAWNKEQTDAELVSLEGFQREYEVIDEEAPGGRYRQNWHFQSRSQCGACHNRRVNFTVAFDPMQLTDVKPAEGSLAAASSSKASAEKESKLGELDQINLLHQAGFLSGELARSELVMCNPHDSSAPILQRSRSYLHANCAHCHRHGGGGNAQFKLQYDFDLIKAGYIGTRPVVGTFGLPRPAVIAPGDPYRSVLYYRMAKLGGGRMPHIGAEQVDPQGLQLMHDWISQLPPDAPEGVQAASAESITDITKVSTTEQSSAEVAEEAQPTLVEQQAAAAFQTLQTKVQGAKADTAWDGELAAAGETLLSTTTGALRAVYVLDHSSLPDSWRQALVDQGSASTNPNIRDLFERYLPEDRRVKRLGSIVDARQLLSLPGNIDRGREFFFKAAAVSCKNCHKVGKQGGEVGPDLTQIGKKLKPAALLESVLEPSKTIDPKYVTYLVETDEGRVFSGLLKERTDEKVTLIDGTGKLIEMDPDSIEVLVPQQKSLMPDLLFRDMTAEQLADLIAFLSSLKE